MAKFDGKKHFVTSLNFNSHYETREEAETNAKRDLEKFNKGGYGYNGATVYEAMAYVTAPIPAYEVVDLK